MTALSCYTHRHTTINGKHFASDILVSNKRHRSFCNVVDSAFALKWYSILQIVKSRRFLQCANTFTRIFSFA